MLPDPWMGKIWEISFISHWLEIYYLVGLNPLMWQHRKKMWRSYFSKRIHYLFKYFFSWNKIHQRYIFWICWNSWKSFFGRAGVSSFCNLGKQYTWADRDQFWLLFHLWQFVLWSSISDLTGTHARQTVRKHKQPFELD